VVVGKRIHLLAVQNVSSLVDAVSYCYPTELT
jgi:hypothetical protein